MSSFPLMVLFLGLVMATKDEGKHSRAKRDLFDLCRMIETLTNGIPCYRLLGFGNHCGPFRNTGPVLNHVDLCCFSHDRCSERTRMSCGFPLLGIVFGAYRWTSSPVDGRIHCAHSSGSCGRAQCLCDSEFAMCIGTVVRTNPGILNSQAPPSRLSTSKATNTKTIRITPARPRRRNSQHYVVSNYI